MEEDIRDRKNLKQPVCPCAVSSSDDILLMVLTLGFRHKLTWVAQLDILKMVNAIYGTKRVIDTKRKYLNKINKAGDCFKYHVYCEYCQNYLGDRNTLEAKFKCKCGKEIDVSKSTYFLSVDVETQMKQLLAKEDIREPLLNYRFQRVKENPSAFEDILDGLLYKKLFENSGILSSPYNFSFSFDTDGVSTGKSTGKTMWPIYMTLNELPLEIRIKHVLLAGLYVGKSDPSQCMYMQPFVTEVNKLSLDGFTWQHNGVEVLSKMIPTCSVVDSVARWQLLNMSAVNSYYACTFCYQKAENTEKGQRFPPSVKEVLQRTTESTLQDMNEAYSLRYHPMETKRVVRGVKGFTPLVKMNHFNLISSFVPDYMHCILIGVTESHLEALLHKTRKKFWVDMPESFSSGHMETLVSERLETIKTLTAISRSVRPLSQKCLWKASEWRSWLIFYGVPCLKGLLKEKYLKHFALLSKATFLLLKKSVTREDILEAHKLYLEYIAKTYLYFGAEECRLNVHLLSHVAAGVFNWGPLWAQNTFIYEGYNHHITQLLQSPARVTQQVARKFLVYKSLPTLSDELAAGKEAIEFCDIIFKTKLKNPVRCKQVLLLGQRHDPNISVEERNLLEQSGINTSDCSAFYRFLYKRRRFSVESYVEAKERNDSIIMTEKGEYGKIVKILSIGDKNVFLIIREIVPLHTSVTGKSHINLQHIKVIETYGDLICIPLEDVLTQCVYMKIDAVKYVADMPYGCWGD